MQGVVTRLFYSSQNFTTGILDNSERGRVKFVTRLPVEVGETLEGFGHWESDPKYGDSFKFQKFSDGNGNVDAEGLAYYLSHHPKLKGVGKKKAEELATKYVDMLLSSLDSDPKELAAKLGLPVETIELLQHEFASSKSPQAIAKLCSYGVSPKQANEIVKKWGADSLRVVEMDPFRLIGVIPGFAFKRTDDVARKVGFPKTHPSRIEAGVKFTLEEAMNDGHTYYERGKLIDSAVELLFLDSLDARSQIDQAISKLVERQELIKVVDGQLDCVQLAEMHKAETGTATKLIEFRDQVPDSSQESGSFQVADYSKGMLKNQCEALIASTCGVSVVCGAAGTGKTFTIRKIYDMLVANGRGVVLCAPTGKAAKRVAQLTTHPAYTIHRLLEHNGAGFQRHEENPIGYDVVIVDEASMVDSWLIYSLLRAMPKNSMLILVGDPNQLPPVGPGCPFLDIIRSNKFKVTTLDEVVRQTGELRTNSAAILEGEVRPTCPPSWYVIDQLYEQEDVLRYLLKMYADMLLSAKKKQREIPQVLSPMSKGKLGTKELNVHFQGIYHRVILNEEVEPARAGRIMRGDRVIQVKNNYEIGVMNGNTGTVVMKTAEGLDVLFDGDADETFVPNDDAGDLQLAYALTVHKSQGSEFKDVILVVHKSHQIMHDRSLIYTGVTRSAQNLYMVGDSWGQKNAAKEVKTHRRRTILSRILK